MNFKYKIENDKLRIYSVIDKSIQSIDIPDTINGNHVFSVYFATFSGCQFLTEINGVKLKDGVNIINNKFVYYNRKGSCISKMIVKIKYQIDDDYIVIYRLGLSYIIGDNFYNPLFNK